MACEIEIKIEKDIRGHNVPCDLWKCPNPAVSEIEVGCVEYRSSTVYCLCDEHNQHDFVMELYENEAIAEREYHAENQADEKRWAEQKETNRDHANRGETSS